MGTANAIHTPPAWQMDPARVRCIGVVTGGEMVSFAHVDPRQGWDSPLAGSHRVETLLDVLWWAFQDSCGAVWIAPPESSEWQAQAIMAIQTAPDGLRLHELTSAGRLAGVVAQRHRGGMPVCIYFIDQGDPWAIAAKSAGLHAGELAEGVSLAAYALGAQLRFSPSYVGLSILRQTLAHKQYDIPPLSDWARELVEAHRPTYVQWSRPFDRLQLSIADHISTPGLRLYKFDRNSSFVASAGEVPVGDPIATPSIVAGRPGLYRVSFEAPPDWPEDIPGPFHVGEGAGAYPHEGETWAWEPQLRLARKHGWTTIPYGGYYWPQKHDLFRVWRERIWQARSAAESYGGPAGAIARAIIKRAGVATIGRLLQRHGRMTITGAEAMERGLDILMRHVDEQGEATGLVTVEAAIGRSDLVQPHWWATIIANANERLFSALYEHGEYHPIAAYVDAVYSASPWPTEHIQADRLGKWKLERSIRVPRAEMDRLNQMSAAEWVKRLARLHREQQSTAATAADEETSASDLGWLDPAAADDGE